MNSQSTAFILGTLALASFTFESAQAVDLDKYVYITNPFEKTIWSQHVGMKKEVKWNLIATPQGVSTADIRLYRENSNAADAKLIGTIASGCDLSKRACEVTLPDTLESANDYLIRMLDPNDTTDKNDIFGSYSANFRIICKDDTAAAATAEYLADGGAYKDSTCKDYQGYVATTSPPPAAPVPQPAPAPVPPPPPPATPEPAPAPPTPEPAPAPAPEAASATTGKSSPSPTPTNNKTSYGSDLNISGASTVAVSAVSVVVAGVVSFVLAFV